MIHRDVKPENVMLCRRGEDDVVKLLDFGLVKNLERVETRDVTKQIKILGTPRYMAPERIVNPADVDARSDVYALGAVGYFLLTGKPIFEGDNNLEISNQVLHAPAPRVCGQRARDSRSARRADRRVPREGPGTAPAVGRSGDRGARPVVDATRVDASRRGRVVGGLSDEPGGIEGISGVIRSATARRSPVGAGHRRRPCRITLPAASSPPSNRARRTTRTTPRRSDACRATRATRSDSRDSRARSRG